MSAYELRILNESTGEYESLAFIQGADGKDAFTEAQKKGYSGTETEFYAMLATHAADGVIHVTEEERSAWDGKAAGIHASQHASGGSDPITPSAIGAALAGDLTSHTGDTTVHVTANERTSWNGKAGKPTVQIITIPNSGWETSGPDEYTGAAYYCSVEVAGVVQDESKQVIYVAPGYANRQSYEAAGVRCIAQDVTSLMFAADSLPSGNLTVYVAVQEAAT